MVLDITIDMNFGLLFTACVQGGGLGLYSGNPGVLF